MFASEGIFENLDRCADDESDIESQSRGCNAVFAGPTECSDADGSTLRGRHRDPRTTEVVVTPGLDFTDRNDLTAYGDNVDLSPAVPNVAGNDVPPLAHVPRCRELFAPGTTGATGSG